MRRSRRRSLFCRVSRWEAIRSCCGCRCCRWCGGSKILENGTDYSIQNTTVHALFLSTSREAKYKAKAAIDTFFMRAGDVLQAGIVLAGTAWACGIKGFAAVNLVLTLVWLAVAVGVAREPHAARTPSAKRSAEDRPRRSVRWG